MSSGTPLLRLAARRKASSIARRGWRGGAAPAKIVSRGGESQAQSSKLKKISKPQPPIIGCLALAGDLESSLRNLGEKSRRLGAVCPARIQPPRRKERSAARPQPKEAVPINRRDAKSAEREEPALSASFAPRRLSFDAINLRGQARLREIAVPRFYFSALCAFCASAVLPPRRGATGEFQILLAGAWSFF